MRAIGSALQLARHKIASGEPWLLFVEVPHSSGTFFRIVKCDRHVEADGKVWQAASMEISLPDEDNAGSLGELSVTLPNVGQIAMAYIEVDGEILGRTLTCYLQHASALSDFDEAVRWDQVILSAAVNEASVTLRCGHPATITRVPGVRFDRRKFPQMLPAGGLRL